MLGAQETNVSNFIRAGIKTNRYFILMNLANLNLGKIKGKKNSFH